MHTSLLMPFGVALATATISWALPQGNSRPVLPPGGSNWVPQAQVQSGTGLATTNLNVISPQNLAEELLGDTVLISNVSFSGDLTQAGLFTGGTGIIGFEEGIVLSTGNVGSVVGPENFDSGTTTAFAGPGDADLEALTGDITHDASTLEFDFECPNSNTASFQFVFTSEEYNDYVFDFNDSFALFLNGQNIALVPGTTDPVTIDTVNCGNGVIPGVNCGQFIDNDCDTIAMGFPCTNVETEMDGLTVVFSAVGTLQPGTNHLKIAIADALDEALDSAVFIRANSLVCGNPAPSFDPPTPCDQRLYVEAGQMVSFDAVALATNGLSNQAVSLDAMGSAAALNGGSFSPALPTVLAQPATSQFTWTPTAADQGLHTITLIATDQLGQMYTCDVEILVQLGTAYCATVANSTGTSGYLYAMGDLAANQNNLTLVGSNLPEGEMGYFLGSRAQGFVAMPGGSQGNLCLGGPGLARFHNTAASVVSGTLTGTLDLTNMPVHPTFGDVVMPGETWYFQLWHRESQGVSNFTNGLCVTFQ
ncbi:MAG: choice-of-anchor L domain-containing protein [Planctomycetota bacterium]|nr:choice-of-anchor L domain-containing protein [Planctomycetota bacterium]